MKIFISHSSKDKWAAKRISDDITSLGIDTFLDEKDIKTGQSIDTEIRNHLKKCDDFLILISPASIKSDWVLLELGGAIALEKNIVPILFYAGANELPQIINLRLSRDINDIEQYYSELEKRLKGKKVTQLKPTKPTGRFKVGEKVRITDVVPEDTLKGPYLLDWETDMNKYLGQETTIRGGDEHGTYTLEIDKHDRDGGFIYAEEWLEKI